MSKNLLDRFRTHLYERRLIASFSRCLVALSGGSDSVALLYLLREIARELNLTIEVAHLNHNLRTQAEEDLLFCQRFCQNLGVNLHTRSLPIKELAQEQKLSLEEAGRVYRYAFFRQLKEERNLQIILTAHTADDQAETVLMRIINGTGLAGLGAIKAREGELVRPLLPFTKEELRSYLRSKGQVWCEDHTNYLPDAPRTKVRWHLLPLLRDWNNQIVDSLNRLAESAQEDNQLLLEMAEKFYRDNKEAINRIDYYQFCNLVSNNGGAICGYALPRVRLRTLYPSIRKRVWLLCYQEALNIYYPHNLRMSSLESCHYKSLEDFLQLPNGKKLPLPNFLQAVWRGDKFIIEPLCVEQSANLQEEVINSLIEKLPVTWESRDWNLLLKFERLSISQRPEPFSICLDPYKVNELLKEGKKFTLRHRKDGDRFQPAGGTGKQKLKKFLQDIKIPQSMRDQIPILCLGEEIVWIIGQRAEQKFLAKPKQEDVLYIKVEYLEKD